ncbi:MAG TPA: hypothetical protein VJ691_02230 [Vicinamibacterales bacterium]|nr:hypothetical protein [Vicinamibacterales bacterium]
MSRCLIAALLVLFVTDERTPVPGFFDLPVTGGAATFDMLGLHPEERGSAIALLARSMFSQGGSAADRAASVRRHIASLAHENETEPISIAVPLTADHWRDLLGPKAPRDLFTALISDRSVLLVCAGSLTTDASMRTLLERDRGLLRWIARTAPAAFWVAARSLRLENGRLRVPGGSAAEPIWEALAGEKVARTSEFLRALLVKDEGRLAWFYDSMATLPEHRARVIAGGGIVEMQLENVRALYEAFRSADTNWRLEQHPFLRGVTDPWIVTTQIGISNGAAAPPAAEWFWTALFERPNVVWRRSDIEADREPGVPVPPAWLVRNVTRTVAKERRDRYAMLRFAQSVFGDIALHEYGDALIALSGYRRYPAVLLSLDRMAITTPRVYSRAVEAASRIDELSGRNRKHAVVAFQAALTIIERARVTRAIDVATARRLVLALADAVESGERRAGAIVQWMLTGLVDALPPLIVPDQWTGRTAYESRFLQALAGAPATSPPTLKWEGLDYRVDYFSSEHARIKRIREQLTSPGLDAAIAAGDEEKIAHALTVLIYAPALGDPEGPALLGGDIPMRHNLGVEGAAGVRREILAWSLPREQVGDGSPWHIEGSLLGLDIALARLTLRRLADNEMPVAPTINLNDLLTLARTVRVLNPEDLTNADRDALVASIARGRTRVAAARNNLNELLALASEAGMSHAIRQTLPWTLTRTPELVESLFGLRDFMWLGKPELPASSLDRWGVFAEAMSGRLITAMPGPVAWESFGGRADGGVIGAQLPDLTLRLAQETARLNLPAQLIPALLTYAIQDFWHDVDSRFPDDWPAMARQALALSPSRVEDYVAALAGDGPLRPR